MEHTVTLDDVQERALALRLLDAGEGATEESVLNTAVAVYLSPQVEKLLANLASDILQAVKANPDIQAAVDAKIAESKEVKP